MIPKKIAFNDMETKRRTTNVVNPGGKSLSKNLKEKKRIKRMSDTKITDNPINKEILKGVVDWLTIPSVPITAICFRLILESPVFRASREYGIPNLG